MDKPKRMDMRAPGNVSETCLAEYQTQPAAYKPNRFIYLKAGHISTSHLDTLVYNNNSVHCNTKFYSDNTHTVYINQTIHSFLSSTRQRAAYPLPHTYGNKLKKQDKHKSAGSKGRKPKSTLLTLTPNPSRLSM